MTFALLDLLLPFSALAYVVGSFLSKKAMQCGMGVQRLFFLQCWISVVPVLLIAPPPWLPVAGAGLATGGLPAWAGGVFAGLVFFLGWLLTLLAIRHGEVSLLSSLMGMKIIFVALLGAAVGLQQLSPAVWAAAALAAVAVALLGYVPPAHRERTGRTFALTALSCLAFAASDLSLAHTARSLGPWQALALLLSVTAIASLGLIPFFSGSLRQVPCAAWGWGLAAAIAMTVQIMTMLYYIGVTGLATEANVWFSVRGLLAVLLSGLAARWLGISSERLTRPMFRRRLAGAALMTIALACLLAR